ncbi:bifunctional metallophosphatase/5'-nucleotidase [Ostreiculturibacter nitratireducens]|uniref:bifunctional metallophosphatase/5'-nucleotidase n=1 Tax=Ostreiculturibacter nitratireducens TaxID=3075226 RepID=UPI0031B62492
MKSRLLASVGALALSAGAASADYSLTILHTNDFHARFEQISRFDSACGDEDAAEGKCFGGTARLVTAINDARARSNNSILLDGGDQFQGTLFYTYYKGAASAEFMNKMGYDAMTVGNHEFDDGPETLRGFMDTVQFPILMSNADVSAEGLLSGAIQKSVVIERGGEKLGLIGLTPVDTPEISSPGKNITFTDPVGAVQAEVDKLTAEGVNKIIVLSHSGYEVDKRIAAEATGVDVIVGGHSHTLLSNTAENAAGPYPTMVGATAIVQAYAYGKFLGELNVTFNDAGEVTEATGEPLILDAAVAQDEATSARVQELAQPLDEIRQKVVAESSEEIDGSRENCRAMECEMGNLVADAMLDRVKGQGIQIAIQNGGGLRASIDAGPVTMGEVLTVLPFQNTLSTFHVKGSTIVAALENGVSQVEEGAGRFPQVAGLSFVWDPAAEPGSRIVSVSVMVDGQAQPIEPDTVYGVVSNNFVRNGGDGYSMFATEATDVYDFGPDLADVTAEYLAAAGPYTPYLDGRISKKE